MQGTVTCGSWIRGPENLNLVVLGKSLKKRDSASPSVLEIFSFDPQTASLSNSPQVTYVFEETEGEPVKIAVHPSGDDFVCSTSKGGCKLLELSGQETKLKLLAKELPPLHDVGPQNCMAFSVDGSKFATGGVDGRLRILEWPSLRIILDEAKAHNSVRDMDFRPVSFALMSCVITFFAELYASVCLSYSSLDSEFLASTSTDGSARIWKAEDGSAVATLTRNSDEKIELCRFSKDGMKPFLFCAVQKGDKAVTSVYDISTWKKIGYKRLLRKPAAVMSISLDGKYLALGSKDGDVCVAEVKTMEVSHLSRRLHLGTCIASLEFCPSQRVVLTTSSEWGAVVTKLNVPADWKEWQIYLVLVGLFLASAIAFYFFFQNSDSFWKFPLESDRPRGPKFEILDPQCSEDAFEPLDISSSALSLQGFNFHHRRPSSPSIFSLNMGTMDSHYLQLRVAVKATPGSPSSAEMSGADVEEEEEKSEIYSHNMTEAMGAGEFNNACSSMLRLGNWGTPGDVDKLRKIGVKTVFCLQQDPDLEYFGVDISAIQDYAKACGDIQHLRAQIRDFDSFDLRIQLPAVVSKLHKAINRNGGVTYIHCTAGLGRAPAVALAYMFWVQGYKLNEAHELLMSKRSSFPKLNAIKSATADILTGLQKKLVTLKWKNNNYSTVEISGLDIGWGQRIPLELDEDRKFWILKRELLEGVYEYKYIVDGEWTVNKYELVTTVNKDGHINNYVEVFDDDKGSVNGVLRKRLTGDDAVLTREDRLKIRKSLETLPGDEE
ncbi:hypothetical protein SADUNF_Sadunf10G0180200 [Salix dunnii]|uniref:Uncharacterized protein n=1 Tax=Salix dunnii TaxID=1413687 RepID=A0A835JUS4_9ROSI|nr:hypothetical protein SADUNF_Sadunf10G0180200 [Salix dunnii]